MTDPSSHPTANDNRQPGRMSRQRVGIIGLGSMGTRIASSLIESGYEVAGFDPSPEACERARQVGATFLADTPYDLAASCRTVVCCVPGASEAEAALLGPDGASRGQSEDDILIDCTTVTVSLALRLGREFADKGVSYLDAPLSGFPPRSVAFVGGEGKSVESAKAVLSAFTQRICHLGPNGSGALGKLLSQYATYCTFVADAHVLREAVRNGLAIEEFVEALRHGSASSMILEGAVAGMLGDGGRDWGRTRLIQKDLGYLSDAGGENPTLDLPLLPIVAEFFTSIPAELADEPISRLVSSMEVIRGNQH